MGRGAQDQTRQMTDQQLAQTNALNQQLLAQQQALGNQVGAQYHTGLLGKTLGIPGDLLNTRSAASRPSGFFSSMGSSLGGTLGGIPALFL